jgi:uncharacterized membrane protein
MYLLLKLLHIVSVIAFLGNITTGLFWHAHAARSRDPKLLEFTMDGIIRSDRWFTMPGVIGVLATGVLAAASAGLPLLRTGWILWTLILFGVSGLAFMFFVAPLQKQLRAFAAAGQLSGTFDFDAYRKLALRWELWGTVALLTPLAGLVLMVLKPAL